VSQSQILYGLGAPDFTSLAGKFVYVEPMSFEITGATGEKVAKKFVKGKMVTAGSLLDGEEYKLKVGIQAASWTALAFAHGEVSKTTASVTLPEVREARVPISSNSSGELEIVDPDLATSAGVWVFQVDPIDKALVISVGVASPPPGTFIIDGANNRLIFNGAEAGAAIVYRIFKTYTNVESIGKEGLAAADVLNQFSFGGLCYSDTKPYRINIPKMSRISVPSLKISDLTTLEVEYRLAVANGERTSYQLYNL
jgi:hypothetical protein